MKKANKQKASIFSTICNIIIYVILVFALFITIYLNITKKENQMSSFLGYSFAVIQSGSMKDGGFNIGDLVVLKKVDTDNLKAGDIITFYRFYDNKDDEVNKSLITEEVNNGTYVEKDTYEDLEEITSIRKTVDEVIDKNLFDKIIFHRITNIYVDDYGVRFFETKGDSNGNKDGGLIREDFVCGLYNNTSKTLANVLNFVITPVGIVCVVLVPIALLLILQMGSFFAEIKGSSMAGRLLSRKTGFYDEKLQKISVGKYLSDAEKVYIYDITPPEHKINGYVILWDENVKDAIMLYDENREKYWNYWIDKADKKDKNEFRKYKIKADLILIEHYDEEKANKETERIFKEKKKNGDFANRNTKND